MKVFPYIQSVKVFCKKTRAFGPKQKGQKDPGVPRTFGPGTSVTIFSIIKVMRRFLSISWTIYFLLAGGIAWSGPIKIGKNTLLQYIKEGKLYFPPKGYFHNEFSAQAIADAIGQSYKDWEKYSIDADALKRQLEEINNQSYRRIPDYTGDDFFDYDAGESSENIPSVKAIVSKPEMPDFHPISLDEIKDMPDILDLYEIAPQNTRDKSPKELQEIIQNVHGALISNMLFREDVLKDASKMMVAYPFETRPMDEIFMESAALFYARPDDILPIDFQFSPVQTQLRDKLELQEDFYFNILPYSYLILTSGRIEPNYLEESIRYYFLTLAVPGVSLDKKIRSLTMLSFLLNNGDFVNGRPAADAILDSVYHSFSNPPWTVDYAAGMALLNLGAPQKIQELLKWRLQLDARRGKRTPGIAWLYGKVFGEYDFHVQDLGAFPHMMPDSKEEMTIMLRELDNIRSHIEPGFEALMWKLSTLKDIVVFLQLKGCIAQVIPPGQAKDDPEDETSPEGKIKIAPEIKPESGKNIFPEERKNTPPKGGNTDPEPKEDTDPEPVEDID